MGRYAADDPAVRTVNPSQLIGNAEKYLQQSQDCWFYEGQSRAHGKIIEHLAIQEDSSAQLVMAGFCI
jgi:hypothetical protein